MPVSVGIHDSLSESPTFIEYKYPKMVVQLFVEDLKRRHSLIVKEVNRIYPRPDDFEMLSERDQKAWNEWVNQVAVVLTVVIMT